MTIDDITAEALFASPARGSAHQEQARANEAPTGTMLQGLVHVARQQTAALLLLDMAVAVVLGAQGSALFPACWFVMVCTGGMLHLLLMATLLTQPGETLAEKQSLAAWSFAGQAVLRLTALLLFPSMSPSVQLGLTAYSLVVAITGPRPPVAPQAARSLALLGTLPVALAWLLPLSAVPVDLRVSAAGSLLLAGGLLVQRCR